jgi:hypothetical protein
MRVSAHENGAWVREAAMAYTEKKKKSQGSENILNVV